MLNILKYRLKSILTNKIYICLFIALSVLVGCISVYIDNNSTENQVFHVSIIDNDKSSLSHKLIKGINTGLKIKIIEDINLDLSLKRLVKGDLDAIYIINEGYEEKIRNNELKNLIEVHKNEESINIDWLSDQISIIGLKEWIYYDMLDRIETVERDYTEEEFNKDYLNSVDKEKIFYLVNHDVNIRAKDGNSLRLPLYFNQIWAYTVLLFIIVYGKGLIDDELNGVIHRYKFYGIDTKRYFFIDLLLKIVTLLIPYVLSAIIVASISKVPINIVLIHSIYTVIYITGTWIIVTILGRVFKEYREYAFACNIFLLVSIFYGLIGTTEGIVRVVGRFIPIAWYISI